MHSHSFFVALTASLLTSVCAQSFSPVELLAEVPAFINDDLVVAPDFPSTTWHRRHKRLGAAWSGHASTFVNAGVSGIGAMQVSVVDDDHILIYDKSQNNPLLDKLNRPAWGAVYTISTKAVRALNVQSNSFCAGGGWISNGTLVSVGGNPTEGNYNWGTNGLTSVRLFTPCTDNKCDVQEWPTRVRLTSQRWYATTARLEDGSLIIWGGMIAGGFNNAPATDNPTIEFYPPKGNGLAVHSNFLHDALNTNLFPIVWQLPGGKLFVAANQLAMLYDWKTNKETRLANFPNSVKVNYPDTAAAVLLPLTVANNWTPEALICGGSTADSDGRAYAISATFAASQQCVRMVLTTSGVKKGWAVETMPSQRVMGDGILMPDGTVLIINGAQTGIAGYGNVKNEVGASNAATANFAPVLYDPLAKAGKRFTTNFPSSSIERLYHSSATLIPDGRIWVSGSSPNNDVTTAKYATRYQVEIFNPPYIFATRPTFTNKYTNFLYGNVYVVNVKVPTGTKVVKAVIMDLGYSTHSVHMNHRHVELEVTVKSATAIRVFAPKTADIYPPGYAWLYILADGIPSAGKRVMIGDGASPPVSQSAIKNMLKKTTQAT